MKLMKSLIFAVKSFFGKKADEIDSAFLIEHVEQELKDSNQKFDERLDKASELFLAKKKAEARLNQLTNTLQTVTAQYKNQLKEISAGNAGKDSAIIYLKQKKTLEMQIVPLENLVNDLEAKYKMFVNMLKQSKIKNFLRTYEIENLKSINEMNAFNREILQESNALMGDLNENSESKYFIKLRDKVVKDNEKFNLMNEMNGNVLDVNAYDANDMSQIEQDLMQTEIEQKFLAEDTGNNDLFSKKQAEYAVNL